MFYVIVCFMIFFVFIVILWIKRIYIEIKMINIYCVCYFLVGINVKLIKLLINVSN